MISPNATQSTAHVAWATGAAFEDTPFCGTCMACGQTGARSVGWLTGGAMCSYCNGEDFTFWVPDVGTPVRQLPSSRAPRQLVVVDLDRDGRRLTVEPVDGGPRFRIMHRSSTGRWHVPRDISTEGLQFHVGADGPALPIDTETLNTEEI